MAQITLSDYLRETEDAITSKRVDEALASCQYVLAYFPESLEAQRLLGEVYLAQGKLEEAQHAFDWVLTNDPEHVIAYCSRALVSERSSDYDTALDCYQQAYELSRGNGQIRQAFNQLSEKTGQPGFMFSRAGLARLYMRGGLLSQAEQEWEIVLAITPDRLDARTGLLEVYWRQGIFDRASQLAEQILQDVPGCLKALSLLAYIIAPQDMSRSQELLKKAEMLDPDLLMTRDLFADQLASHQSNPFLKLLNRPPATLGAVDQAAQTAAPQLSDAFGQVNSPLGPVSADALASWGSNPTWNNDTTLVKPGTGATSQAGSGATALPSWLSEGITPGVAGNPAESTLETSNSPWDNDSRSFQAPEPLAGQSTGSEQSEPWELLQEALNGISPDVVRQASDPGLSDRGGASWLGDDPLFAPDPQPEDMPADDHAPAFHFDIPAAQESETAWSFAGPDVEASNNAAPPAWLNQLTQKESEQVPSWLPQSSQSVPDEALAWQSPSPNPDDQYTDNTAEPVLSMQPPVLQEPVPVPQVGAPDPSLSQPVAQPVSPDLIASDQLATPVANQPTPPSQPESADDELPFWARQNSPDDDNADDEELGFNPAWLKSLGATSYDGLDGAQPEEEPTPSTVAETSWQQSEPEAQGDQTWQQSESQEPTIQEVEPAWQPPVSQEVAIEQSDPADMPQPSQENDPWASWQANYADSNQPSSQEAYQSWSDFSSPQPEGQDVWSSAQQNHQNDTAQEQPSWMQQLSQHGAASSGSDYGDWGAAFADVPAPVQPDIPVWDDVANPQAADISAYPEQDASQIVFEPSQEPDARSTLAEEPSEPAYEDPWAKLSQQLQSQSVDYNWLAQLAGSPSSTEATPALSAAQDEPALPALNEQVKTEQDLVNTLESLEQQLLSKGFTQLEPNSLASIAQAHEDVSHAEPTLSSALAELGNFFPGVAEPAPRSVDVPPMEAPVTEIRQEESVQQEPAWLSSLSNVSGSAAIPAAEQSNTVSQTQEEPSWLAALGHAPEAATPLAFESKVPEPLAEEMTVRAPALPSPLAKKPVKASAEPPVAPPAHIESALRPSMNQTEPEPVPAPVARLNVLLDNELETTMKRPAVRLQPMQHQHTMQREATNNPLPSNRGRGGERSAASQRTASDSNVSHRDRLLKGYQAQLIGDYDNAMQEYRVIIRSAPELLGEVVSNMRALLKLAPNYSAGYRVLGDAYMRQGEYLQAMEAYNKALTMAKKAKG
ncbi:tetratricopeptide repeat protein [Dictyobacter arantiisoli]|uniref:Bacterial transcriptional activator domain-containing protein n=1 Tax=Dictyobacter arantiisoli TaxID=2014874 RepID=A0A5A5T7X4_9CHLR|nr:tetratricopeptide repeat protein [Dictyobacter arantiisoli]GCF07316.1 hypothetical protein KDI_08800 [Dictyobacter arantiisoli]